MHNKIYSSLLIKIIISIFLLLILTGINITSFAALSNNNHVFPNSLNDESEKSWSIDPYFTQSIYLKWQQGDSIGNLQGLLVPELGTIITSNPGSDISVYFDFSMAAQIYDIYNIQFAPIIFTINEAYLNYKTDFTDKYMPDILKCEIYPESNIYDNNDIYNLGLEATWIPKKYLELYVGYMFYDLNLWDDSKLSSSECGLTIGAQWYDIFNSEDDKHTDLKMEYSEKDNKILFQITQQINDDLSLELAYAQHFSTYLTYNINENCQFEITGLLDNTQNINNQPNQNIKEFSLITAFTYKF